MTVLQLVTSSLRLIGKLGPGQGSGQSWLADALFVLNSMLDAWQTERLNVFQIVRETPAALTGQASYLLSDLSIARPTRIEAAGILPSGSTTETPLELLTLARHRAGVSGLYSDNAFPSPTIYLTPTPAAGDSLVLYTWQPFTAFASTSDTVDFPAGYADAIRYNLALKLAPEWGAPVRADVAKMAVESKAAIQSLNVPRLEMRVDPALLTGQRYGL